MGKRCLFAFLCMGFWLVVLGQPSDPPRWTATSPGIYAELETSKGWIVLRLDYERVPMTVANFIGLAEGTIANRIYPVGVPFFNGSPFHRVVPGHVIQAGMPAKSQAEGPGYEIPNEIRIGLRHDRAGILGMANAGPHTNGSQFYITLAERSYLDGDYTVFGEVIWGLDVVFLIVLGDVIDSVRIVREGKSARAFKTDDISFRKRVAEAKAQGEKSEKKRKANEEKMIRKKWPNALTLKPGFKFLVLRNGSGEAPAPGSMLRVRYQGKKLVGSVFVSLSDGTPGAGEEPVVFPFRLGSSSVNPGVDGALASMKKGEKQLLILSSEHAYAESGFYGKSEAGKKRFVISPRSTLIYELELIDVEH